MTSYDTIKNIPIHASIDKFGDVFDFSKKLLVISSSYKAADSCSHSLSF